MSRLIRKLLTKCNLCHPVTFNLGRSHPTSLKTALIWLQECAWHVVCRISIAALVLAGVTYLLGAEGVQVACCLQGAGAEAAGHLGSSALAPPAMGMPTALHLANAVCSCYMWQQHGPQCCFDGLLLTRVARTTCLHCPHAVILLSLFTKTRATATWGREGYHNICC